MITAQGYGKTAYWSVTCDICHDETEQLAMFGGKMIKGKTPGTVLRRDGTEYEVPMNHYAVCDIHTFNQETGEWE